MYLRVCTALTMSALPNVQRAVPHAHADPLGVEPTPHPHVQGRAVSEGRKAEERDGALSAEAGSISRGPSGLRVSQGARHLRVSWALPPMSLCAALLAHGLQHISTDPPPSPRSQRLSYTSVTATHAIYCHTLVPLSPIVILVTRCYAAPLLSQTPRLSHHLITASHPGSPTKRAEC